MSAPCAAGEDWLGRAIRLRREASAAFFASQEEPIVELCHRLAERFARGGRLLALAATASARSDVRHVAVEFVHPVIGGKPALPALGLTPEGGPLDAQLALLARPEDAVLALHHDSGEGRAGGQAEVELRLALRLARARGCLTAANAPLGADLELVAPSPDPFLRQELAEALYHVVWELVYLFLDHRGLLDGRRPGRHHDAGASAFLYPFLSESERDLDAVRRDVRDSVRLKAEDSAAVRARTLDAGRPTLERAARLLRERLDAGGTLLALGNGGSASDAMDVAADLRAPPRHAGAPRWPARPALDLSEDTAIVTALANDVGAEQIFARQVAAFGRPEDVLIAFSTSGGSPNVRAALAEARRRGLGTLALVGYDGGAIAEEELADLVLVSRSEHVPRIQEAQASAWHVLRERMEAASGAASKAKKEGEEARGGRPEPAA